MHYGSLYLQTGLLPDWVAILRRAKALGMTVSLDTNWDPHGNWNHGFLAALEHIDILLPNEQEALHLSGQADLEAAVEYLRARMPLLVVKRAEAGATAWQGGACLKQVVSPAHPDGDASARATALTRASWRAGFAKCLCLTAWQSPANADGPWPARSAACGANLGWRISRSFRQVPLRAFSHRRSLCRQRH